MEPLNRFPRMMQGHLVARVRAVDAANQHRITALDTPGGAQSYVAELREKLPQMLGESPERRDLNVRGAGTVELDDFTIEKVVFDSRPDFPVTANVYVPRDADFPAPAVIIPSGHSREARGVGYNQAAAQLLARNGFMHLA